jgi:hypothetical protein
MEQFVTKFARWYTPLVVVACLCLALIPLAARVPDPKVWGSTLRPITFILAFDTLSHGVPVTYLIRRLVSASLTCHDIISSSSPCVCAVLYPAGINCIGKRAWGSPGCDLWLDGLALRGNLYCCSQKEKMTPAACTPTMLLRCVQGYDIRIPPQPRA